MRRAIALPLIALAAVLLGSCAGTPFVVDDRHAARSQASRVLHLVIHYTVEDEAASLALLTQGRVSAHYLVGDGDPPRVYRLVPEERMAFHAGSAQWQGQQGLNATSIGIEVVNAGWRDGPQGRDWAPYPPAQVDAVVALVRDIVRRHGIRPDRVLAHSDIAPARKQDPGPLFPWQRLAAEGLVAWPDQALVRQALPGLQAALPDVAWFQAKLARVGYAVPTHGQLDGDTRQALQAFQMKYRPQRHDGEPDAMSAALLQALADASGR